jgi:hypothetical protein
LRTAACHSSSPITPSICGANVISGAAARGTAGSAHRLSFGHHKTKLTTE